MSEPNVKGKWESFLVPDEIVINILSRLHPKDVLRCRCVIKKWRDLTSTPYFVDLHKQHGKAPMIIVDVPMKNGRSQSFIEEWWIRERKRPPTLKMYGDPCHSEFSQDGLLVMAITCVCCNKIVIVNPIFREKVTILVSKKWPFWIGKVYGVYFHPTLKEYCLLFNVSLKESICKEPYPLDSSAPKPPVMYKMLTLGPKPCLRDIQTPYKDTDIKFELSDKNPVKVGWFLYWLIDIEGPYPTSNYGDIMEFDTRTDEFKLMSCPAPMTDYGRFALDLLNIDGCLSLVHLSATWGVVKVRTWTLKDRASESWEFSDYDLDHKPYPPDKSWMRYETIDVRGGEMLIRSEQKLYVCSLEWGDSKVLGSKTYKEYSTFVSHDTCLSSLKGCKPVIHIGDVKKCPECIKIEKKCKNSRSNSAVSKHSDSVEEIATCGLDEGTGSST